MKTVHEWMNSTILDMNQTEWIRAIQADALESAAEAITQVMKEKTNCSCDLCETEEIFIVKLIRHMIPEHIPIPKIFEGASKSEELQKQPIYDTIHIIHELNRDDKIYWRWKKKSAAYSTWSEGFFDGIIANDLIGIKPGPTPYYSMDTTIACITEIEIRKVKT